MHKPLSCSLVLLFFGLGACREPATPLADAGSDMDVHVALDGMISDDGTSDAGVSDSATDVPPFDGGADWVAGDFMFSEPSELDAFLPAIDPARCSGAATEPDFDVDAFNPVTVCPSGCDHTTLESAIEAAEPYDDIQLAAGHYDTCIRATASPLSIRGVGGMAHFEDVVCDSGGRLFDIRSAHILLSNIRVTRFRQPNPAEGGQWTPLHLGVDVQQAFLSRLWMQDVDYAVTAAGTGTGAVYIDRIKVERAGYMDRTGHAKGPLSLANREQVVVRRSVFSDFERKAWLVSLSRNPYFEFTCNVVHHELEDNSPNDHFFHVFHSGDLVFRANYFYEAHGRLPLYVYYTDAPPTLRIEDNIYLFDDPDSGPIGIVGEPEIDISNNIVVGSDEYDLTERGPERIRAENNEFTTREAMGYEATGIPSSWPITWP